MANNPYYNKVVKGNQTIIDLTSDTVTPADVLAGVTFHDASGAACVGTGAGGKTIASIAPTGVPVAWSSVVATYEIVSRDFDVASGNGSKVTRTYQIPFTNPQSSINPEDYGISLAIPKRYCELEDTSGPVISALAPSGELKSTGNITPTTTTGTASGDDDNAWAASAATGRTTARLVVPDNLAFTSINVALPEGESVRKVEVNSDGTYDVEFTDDTTATSGTYSGSVVSTAYGNECIISCECTGVTGTASAYAPGYLVTYSDNTTETILASSGDVATGAY